MTISEGDGWILLNLGDMRDEEEAKIKWDIARRLLAAWRADNGSAAK